MDFYYEKLSNVDGISLRKYADWCDPVHWMMTITLDEKYNRDEFLSYMKDKSIDCRQMINPVHHAEHFQNDFNENDFTNSINISRKSVHLPSSTSLNRSHINKIYSYIKSFLQN